MVPEPLARVYIGVKRMISLSKMNQHTIVVNADQIEVIEETPDTVITLMNGHKYIVTDSVEEVIEKVVKYKQRIYNLTR